MKRRYVAMISAGSLFRNDIECLWQFKKNREYLYRG